MLAETVTAMHTWPLCRSGVLTSTVYDPSQPAVAEEHDRMPAWRRTAATATPQSWTAGNSSSHVGQPRITLEVEGCNAMTTAPHSGSPFVAWRDSSRMMKKPPNQGMPALRGLYLSPTTSVKSRQPVHRRASTLVLGGDSQTSNTKTPSAPRSQFRTPGLRAPFLLNSPERRDLNGLSTGWLRYDVARGPPEHLFIGAAIVGAI